jgi:hypothetical protein
LKLILIKWIVKLTGNIQFFWSPFFCLLWGDTHYKVKGSESREVLNKVKRGDILLRRYDRYVSGWFIPGYYTHAGLFVGEDNVIHATTKGVIEEDILSFLRTDYVVVLRFPDSTYEEISRAIERAYDLLGKKYDFVFDATDDDRFYCSEVVKYAYDSFFQKLNKKTAIRPDEFLDKGLTVVHDSSSWRKQEG